jgi:5'(3')-deoxyribonucleotidase
MRLGIDLDGVTADWRGTVLKSLGLDPEKSPAITWDSIFGEVSMTPNELFDYVKHEHIFAKCDPIDGAVDGIRLLEAQGHDVVFVTHRPNWAAMDTLMWLDDHLGRTPDGEGWETYFVQDKSLANCDIYLDDSPHVLAALRKKAVVRVVRFKQPWNAKSKAWRSVDTWPEFVGLIGREVEEAQPRIVSMEGTGSRHG